MGSALAPSSTSAPSPSRTPSSPSSTLSSAPTLSTSLPPLTRVSTARPTPRQAHGRDLLRQRLDRRRRRLRCCRRRPPRPRLQADHHLCSRLSSPLEFDGFCTAEWL